MVSDGCLVQRSESTLQSPGSVAPAAITTRMTSRGLTAAAHHCLTCEQEMGPGVVDGGRLKRCLQRRPGIYLYASEELLGIRDQITALAANMELCDAALRRVV